MSNSPPSAYPLLSPGDLTRATADPSPKEPLVRSKEFRFCPSDAELLAYYLKPKVQNEPWAADLIGEVDLYKYEPWDLIRQARIATDSKWYFFSRPHQFHKRNISRKTEKGYWRPIGQQEKIWQAGRSIGSRKTFAYHLDPQPHGRQTHWIMHEYQLENEEISEDLHVLCVIKEKNSDVVEEHKDLPIYFQQVTCGTLGLSTATERLKTSKSIASATANLSEIKEEKKLIASDGEEKMTCPVYTGSGDAAYKSIGHSGKKKIVMTMPMDSKKRRVPIFNTIAKHEGVESVSIDYEKDTLTVVGTVDLDPACIIASLRRMKLTAKIVRVGVEAKEEKKEDDKKKEWEELCKRSPTLLEPVVPQNGCVIS